MEIELLSQNSDADQNTSHNTLEIYLSNHPPLLCDFGTNTIDLEEIPKIKNKVQLTNQFVPLRPIKRASMPSNHAENSRDRFINHKSLLMNSPLNTNNNEKIHIKRYLPHTLSKHENCRDFTHTPSFCNSSPKLKPIKLRSLSPSSNFIHSNHFKNEI